MRRVLRAVHGGAAGRGVRGDGVCAGGGRDGRAGDDEFGGRERDEHL